MGLMVVWGTFDKTSAWPTCWWHVILTCCSTTLDHKMSALGMGESGANRGCRGYWGLHMKNEDGLLQSTLENLRQSIADNITWAQVNGTQVCTTFGHQMSYLGALQGIGVDGSTGYLTKHQPDPQTDQMSWWPAVVSLLTTRCLYWRWGIRGWQGV